MESHPVSARDAVAAEPPERALNEREARENLPVLPADEPPPPTDELDDVEEHGEPEPDYYGHETDDDSRGTEPESRGRRDRDKEVADPPEDEPHEREPEERRERASDERRQGETASTRRPSRYEASPRSSAPQTSYSQRQHESRERSRPAEPAAIRDAIEEVNRVIDSLKHALDDMEEVLETLELAERQKDADEQEIESLRRAVRQLQRPRDSGHRH
jgi:hypothetical protein